MIFTVNLQFRLRQAWMQLNLVRRRNHCALREQFIEQLDTKIGDADRSNFA